MSFENSGELTHDQLANEYAGQLLDVMASPDAHESLAFTKTAAGVILEAVAVQLQDQHQVCELRADISTRLQHSGADEEQAELIVRHILPDRRGLFTRVAADPKKYGYCPSSYSPKRKLSTPLRTN